MPAWPDIDPQILRLLIDGGEELIRTLWHAFTGDGIDQKKLDAIRRKGQEGFAKAIQDEIEQQAQVANLALQLAKLGPLAERVLDAFNAAEHSTMPKLNEILNIEEIKDFEKPEGT
jgi:hypothetical protein